MRLVFSLLFGMAGFAAQAAELLMVEQKGCVWCRRFDAEIAPGYPRTPEGQRAPLRRVDLHQPLPEGVNVAEAARLTPTFILLDDAGKELGRLVGYPGDQFFYPALLDLMKKLPERKP